MGSAALASRGRNSNVRRWRSRRPQVNGLLPGLSESPNRVRRDLGRSRIHRTIIDPIPENFEIAPIRGPNGSNQRELTGAHSLQHVGPAWVRRAWGEQAGKLAQLSDGATRFGAQGIPPAIVDWHLVCVADLPRIDGWRPGGGI